ncbi:MAG TPA: VCBS repeat-containing protein, partial [Bacteroidia bacterium]|nr:VCBS repeat-containing protein [Bacteroidia bacterium]
MLGNGIGNFSAPITYSVGSNPFSLLSEDLNNDGILDLITSNYTSGDISILFGNGTGGFSPSVKYTVDDKPGGMEIGDFTNDGKNDI